MKTLKRLSKKGEELCLVTNPNFRKWTGVFTRLLGLMVWRCFIT